MENVITLDLLQSYTDLFGTRVALLKRNKAYVRNDIVQRDGKYFVCLLSGTTGSNTIDVSSYNIGDVFTDGTVRWKRIQGTIDIRHEISGYELSQGINVKATEQGELIANDLLKDVRAAGRTDELVCLGTKELKNQEIFDNWTPFTCDSNGSNWNTPSSSDQAAAKASYSFNTTYDAIICNRNNEAFSAFISKDYYRPHFTVDYTIDNRILAAIDPSLPGDDDGLFFICGFMQDINGNYHTLSVIRTGDSEAIGGAGHGVRFAIAYDLFTSWVSSAGSTMKLLASNNSLTPHAWDSNSYANIQVTKTSSTITAKTSQINSSSFAVTLTYTLPSSKPNDMTQEQYDNIKYMMEHDSKVGFGTQSNPSAFRLSDSSGAVNGVNVYNTETIQKLYYEDGVKISESADTTTLLPQEFVYSKLNRRLFFVKNNTDVIEMVLNTICEQWVSETFYVINQIVQYGSGVYRCIQANYDTTFDSSKWEQIGGKIATKAQVDALFI